MFAVPGRPGSLRRPAVTTIAGTESAGTEPVVSEPRLFDIHVIADSDTRWKWGAALARRLVPGADVRVHAVLLEGRSAPNDRQVDETGYSAINLRRVGMSELVEDLADTKADVIVLACTGGAVQALIRALSACWRTRADRPVVVTGYVGLVYERAVDGLLLRAGADVVLANSAVDAQRFRDVYQAMDADPDTVVQAALPFLGGRPYDPTAAGRDRAFTTTFVSQPGVPESRDERRYAMAQVLEHATRNPSRQVIVKLRGRPGERTTHVEPHHYATMLANRRLPDNVELAYGSMSDVLDRTDLCVTVSSTAAIEAMHRQIPTGILTDFGIRESLGNHVFLHSGAFVSWTALHAGAVPKTDPGWAADNGVDDRNPFAAAAGRVAALMDPTAQLPPLRAWWDATDAAGYLPALLAKYGVDVFGMPLRGPLPAGAGTPWPRRALRSTARRALHVAGSSLEPRIRRWAQQ